MIDSPGENKLIDLMISIAGRDGYKPVAPTSSMRPWFCRRCGKELARGVITCVKCLEEERAIAAIERLSVPLASIPERYNQTFETLLATHAAAVAGCDTKYLALVPDGDALERAARAALVLVEKPSGPILSVTLVGDTGAGKTTLAAAVLRGVLTAARQALGHPAWHLRRWPIAWIEAVKLAHVRSQSSFGDEPAEMREACTVPVLVLDDLGQEGEIRGGREAMIEVIHRRHSASLPTIITTGLAKDGEICTRQGCQVEIGRRYGVALQRRLFEQSNPILLRKAICPVKRMPSLLKLGGAP
jgi:DNA replication protein DnaC